MQVVITSFHSRREAKPELGRPAGPQKAGDGRLGFGSTWANKARVKAGLSSKLSQLSWEPLPSSGDLSAPPCSVLPVPGPSLPFPYLESFLRLRRARSFEFAPASLPRKTLRLFRCPPGTRWPGPSSAQPHDHGVPVLASTQMPPVPK